MKRLRHPIRAIREPFGTAGLIVAVVALIAALAGGAVAATNGSGNGQATASAKKHKKAKAKRGPRGPRGKTGPAGPQGPAGAKGDKGDAGAAGKDGANGTSGATGPQGPQGPEGPEGPEGPAGPEGPRGPEGEPGVIHPGETLPSEATETGAWSLGTIPAAAVPPAGTFALVAISFPVPLAAGLDEQHVHYINAAGEEVTSPVSKQPSTVCLGTVASPTAAAGHLCIYASLETNAFTIPAFIRKPDTPITTPGAGVTGSIVNFAVTGAGNLAAAGSWAVTAP